MHPFARSLLFGAIVAMSLAAAFAEDDLEEFWQRGKVRELLVNGLPADDEGLRMWAEHGVNCVLGVNAELAQRHGLKTRSWFTMNLMSHRLGEERLKAMAAINEDGSYRRPYDPLFPTVADNWTGCIHNPGWIEHSREVFRNKARAGDDGCHIDYAGHYEPCFCAHCEAAWEQWAPQHGLEGMDLRAVTRSADLRPRMLLREFRIQAVMDFLRDLRDTAREIKPGFAIDGTWHQDNGSTYQWAYGDHFELMCIEGTTWGPFPPEGTQLLWMKLAHALSERSDRRPVAMSVTYHLLRDEEGRMFHGRMAADRLRVALAEIISEGGVSWKGLGGPGTGNLLREHQDIVRAYYSLARDIEPLLVDAEDVGSLGIVFSPRSYLLTGVLRTQLYAIGQALLKAHVPFRLLSDVGLEAEALRGLSGVVLLSARALSDEACAALEAYVQGGGRVLVIGEDAATLTEDWRERADRPAFAVSPEGDDAITRRQVGQGECLYWASEVFAGKALGAAQNVVLNHDRPIKMAVEGWSRAEDVAGAPDANYSLYVDLIHDDGSPLWGQTALFAAGTHDWEFSRRIIESDRPFRSANVHMLFRNRPGTVWFKDVRFGVWDEERQEIVENLLGDTFRDAEGAVYSAAPGEDAPRGVWGPYRDGFTVRNMLDQGLWVEMSSTTGLAVGAMHEPDEGALQVVLAALAPLLPAAPPVTLEGEGAECVSANVTRAGERVAVHLINHRAELHPELSESEQQEADRTIPATDLTLTLRLVGLDLRAETMETHFPEGRPQVSCEATEGGVRVHLAELAQYAVLSFTAAGE